MDECFTLTNKNEKNEKIDEHYAESCRECDGDIEENGWCFKCKKPVGEVLSEKGLMGEGK